MPFWNKKPKENVPMTNKEITSSEKSKESTLVNLDDIKQDTPVESIEDKMDTYVDDETIVTKPEVLSEENETKFDDEEIEEDEEVLALQKQLEEIKERKAREKAEQEAMKAKEVQIEEQPTFDMQQPRVILVNDHEMLKLLYDRIVALDIKVSALLGEANG